MQVVLISPFLVIKRKTSDNDEINPDEETLDDDAWDDDACMEEIRNIVHDFRVATYLRDSINYLFHLLVGPFLVIKRKKVTMMKLILTKAMMIPDEQVLLTLHQTC